MPSGTDFKYSTGDTTLWKSKYYAFVDYALSLGASVADIEAFLAENSSFTPGTAPTALASLNAVTATTADNLEYQITHGTPYASLTANLWFLVRMPTANAGAMTLKVDALAAKSVYVGGNPTAGGEFTANGVYLLAYDSGNDRFDVVGPRGRTPTLQVFTASGTWNRPSGCRAVLVEVQGAGGGGESGNDDGNRSGGGGGGAGGYAAKLLDVSAIDSATITVGAGGAGGTPGNGSSGGSSSWADGTNTITGSGGAGAANNADVVSGGSGSGGEITIAGGAGTTVSGAGGRAGRLGGTAPRGLGLPGKPGANGINGQAAYAGVGYGAGGSGGGSTDGYANGHGAAGLPGIVMVTEFY